MVYIPAAQLILTKAAVWTTLSTQNIVSWFYTEPHRCSGDQVTDMAVYEAQHTGRCRGRTDFHHSLADSLTRILHDAVFHVVESTRTESLDVSNEDVTPSLVVHRRVSRVVWRDEHVVHSPERMVLWEWLWVDDIE